MQKSYLRVLQKTRALTNGIRTSKVFYQPTRLLSTERKYKITYEFEPPMSWKPVQVEYDGKTTFEKTKETIKKYPFTFWGTVATVGGILFIAAIRDVLSPDSSITSIMPGPIQGLLRVVRATITLVAIVIDYKWTELRPSKDPEQQQIQVHKRSANRLLNLCLANGGVYIKAGQHIASLNQILPVEYTKTMEPCQDRAPTRPWHEVEKIFVEELGHPHDYYFKYLDKEPIAAASLAQVYRGILHDGTEVALKIQYPRLRETAFGDIKTFNVLMSVAEWAFPQVRLKWLVKEFQDNLPNELDFRLEGKNNERLMESLEKKFTNVRTPKVYWDMTSERVLTLEFIDHAVKVSDRNGLAGMNADPSYVAKLLTEVFSQQIFIDGFVHCDPHPGNMLVRRNPNTWNNALELVILDHGLYQHMDDDFKVLYAKLWKSIVDRNEESVRDVAIKLGVEHYELFASMLTARSWAEEKTGLGDKLSDSDKSRLLVMAQESFGTITQVLAGVNRKVLLLLKCNDLLRSVQMELGVPVNYFVVFARYAMQGINRSRLQQNPSILTYLSCLWDYTVLSWKLRIYEWLTTIQRGYSQVTDTFQKGFALQRANKRLVNHQHM